MDTLVWDWDSSSAWGLTTTSASLPETHDPTWTAQRAPNIGHRANTWSQYGLRAQGNGHQANTWSQYGLGAQGTGQRSLLSSK